MVKGIAERKNVLVMFDSTTTTVTSFNFEININFQPDEVILKNLVFSNSAGGTSDVIWLESNLIDSIYPFIAMQNASVISIYTNVVYPIYKPIQGYYQFDWLTSITDSSKYKPISIQGQISLLFEFIKYEK
jgi:hypothetical protein